MSTEPARAEGNSQGRMASLSGAQVYALLLLMVTYTCHAIDRQIVSIVLEPIKRDLHAPDKLMGFIPLAFSIAFICAVMPIGALIDKVHRVRLLAGLVAAWSLMTSLPGLATAYPLLVAARMGVGVAEAGAQPLSLSLLSDIFPQERRASALGIFYLATGIGAIIAFLFGSFIAATFGWRITFLIGGLPGLVLAPVLIWTLKEPRRGAMDPASEPPPAASASSVREALRFAIHSPPVVGVLLATFLSSFVLGSFLVWVSSFMMRQYGLPIKVVGAEVALAGGVMPALGAVVFGFCADGLGRRHSARVGWMCAISAAAMAISGVLFTLAPTPMLALACLIAFGFSGGGWMAPSLALLISLTPTRSRGAVLAFSQIFTALGAGLGPFAVGWLSDLLHNLGPALSCCAFVCVGAVVLYGVAVTMAQTQRSPRLSTVVS